MSRGAKSDVYIPLILLLLFQWKRQFRSAESGVSASEWSTLRSRKNLSAVVSEILENLEHTYESIKKRDKDKLSKDRNLYWPTCAHMLHHLWVTNEVHLKISFTIDANNVAKRLHCTLKRRKPKCPKNAYNFTTAVFTVSRPSL